MKYKLIAIFCIMVTVMAMGQSSGAVPKFYDAEMNYDTRFAGVLHEQNLANKTQVMQTTIGEWQRDLGSEMPNGTYWGTYFTGSKFRHYFDPIWEESEALPDWWRPVWGIPSDAYRGRFSYVMVASHFNFSSQVIMNGASEWWVRLPISPQCVEVAAGLTMCVFKDLSDNASDAYFEGNYFSNNSRMRPSISGYMPDDYIIYEFNRFDEFHNATNYGNAIYNPMQWDSSVDFTTGVGVLASDRIYLRVNSILLPNTDYIIALSWRLPKNLASRAMYTYWAGPDDMGNWTHMEFAEFEFTPDDSGLYVSSWFVDKVGNSTFDQPMDMDWSFIFTEGIGAGGLFGRKISFQSNSTLTLFPFVNTSRTGTQHMSFMFPFIAEQNFTVHPEIKQGCGGPVGAGPLFSIHVWGFADSSYEFDPRTYPGGPFIWYNYTDFILFSSNQTISFSGGLYDFEDDDRWNVRVELYFLGGDPPDLNVTRNYEMTMLCYVRDRPPTLWTSINESQPWNTSTNPWARPFLIAPDITEYYYYEVYCSGRGTNDQWAMYLGTYSGKKLYTYHFPQIIWINPQEWKINEAAGKYIIKMSQKDGYYSRVNDWWGQYYFGDQIKTAWYDPIRQGRIGQVQDKVGDLLDAFRQIGEWLYVIGCSFVGEFIDFIQEAIDGLVALVIALSWIVAPFTLIVMLVLVGRTVKVPDEEVQQTCAAI